MSEEDSTLNMLVAGMRQAIGAYGAGALRLDQLAWELKSRIAALREVGDESWCDELKSMWNQLELVNAFYIESGRDALSADENNQVSEILDEISAAIVPY